MLQLKDSVSFNNLSCDKIKDSEIFIPPRTTTFTAFEVWNTKLITFKSCIEHGVYYSKGLKKAVANLKMYQRGNKVLLVELE